MKSANERREKKKHIFRDKSKLKSLIITLSTVTRNYFPSNLSEKNQLENLFFLNNFPFLHTEKCVCAMEKKEEDSILVTTYLPCHYGMPQQIHFGGSLLCPLPSFTKSNQ